MRGSMRKGRNRLFDLREEDLRSYKISYFSALMAAFAVIMGLGIFFGLTPERFAYLLLVLFINILIFFFVGIVGLKFLSGSA